MAIVIKNPQQIQKMRKSCGLVKRAFDLLDSIIEDGITTRELDAAVVKFLKQNGAKPSFKNYRGFPKSVCISVNDEVVHGIPSGRKLSEGDIISVDIGAYLNGFHGDAARTFGVGKISADSQRLIDVTKDAFFRV
jgi:methionyl aminopeptidase